MKICLINNLYFPYQRGGAEKVTASMAAKLQQEGHEVFLVTTKPKKVDYGVNSWPRTIYFPSNFYHLSNLNKTWRFFWHLYHLLFGRHYFRWRKLWHQEKPDLVISHNLMGLGFIAPLTIRQAKIKHHHFLHDIQLLHPSGLIILGQEKNVDSFFARLYQTITKYLLSSPDLIISPSKWLLQEHQKRGFFRNSHTEIKPLINFFNFETKNQFTENLNQEKKKNEKLLFIGQMEEHKGVNFLLQAFTKLADKSMRLTLAGDGSLLNKLREDYKHDSRLLFLGRLDQNSLQKEMAAADLLIVPSLCYENSPTVILEAQAANLPVVASNLGGILEITKKRDRLFEAGNAIDLFAKIKS